MEHRNRIVQLTLIEVKQGETAIKTDENKVSSGLKKHYEDFLAFKSNQEYVNRVAKDMLLVLKQKKELGIVKGLEKLFGKEITEKGSLGNKVKRI